MSVRRRTEIAFCFVLQGKLELCFGVYLCVLCTGETYVLIGACIADVQPVHIVAVNSPVCIFD